MTGLPDPNTEPTITVDRAAAILSLGRRTAYAAVERGEIPSIRIGRRIVVPSARFLATFGLETTPRNSEAGPATGPAAASIQKDATTDEKPSGYRAA
jgi:excisionase family DNA binding protein